MELRGLGQTSGSLGCEPWVNFKPLPPSRRRWGPDSWRPVQENRLQKFRLLCLLSLYETLTLICEKRGRFLSEILL